MNSSHYLKCINCSQEYKPTALYKCPNCKNILEVKYLFDHAETSENKTTKGLKSNFIFHDGETDSLLGEGDTPLLSLNTTAKKLGVKRVLGKCEFLNPTGSFKDRPVAAGIKKAVDFGYKKVIVASSGNGAAAVAAYSSKLGLQAVILVPESTPAEKVKQSQFFGAKVIKVKGPYSNSYELALKISEEGEAYNLTTTFLNPYTIEGDKGVAYEVDEQADIWPDSVVVPIGAGPLLVGIYKGFKELNEFYGLRKPLPKMIGIQAAGCSPIVKAFKGNSPTVTAEPNPKTIAGGIGDGLNGYSDDGAYTLNIIRESKGLCIEVTDEEILSAQKDMAIDEGLFIEPSAAASLAGLLKVSAQQDLSTESVMLLLTGHGLKDIKSLGSNASEIPCIEPDLATLKELIEEA